ncbi:uncharacterized protein LOC124457764 [Xenia sp. Carnegie-2017]|uniref:uncharacterized protein LOC124457764 n=1 Tax=Xenia sp. Carnegie-2017 TaxID=2897299 RepID=UPI001F040147|nr:uncharacterized protein LOC124457764 [Xenia sp. Carnegie-2017]
MKKGYGLWREGYVKNTMVKANVPTSNGEVVFVVKARVGASMKSVSYSVFVHLNQRTAEVEYSICNCKAGQGGCCKHVAELLYTVLDFVNLKLSAVSAELKCTQLPQKWNVPSGNSRTLEKAVKFEHLLFEKADVNKTNEQHSVRGVRENYCLTPPYAQELTREDIKIMADAFQKVNRASLLYEAFKSNEYQPCNTFETSCNRMIKRRKLVESLPEDPSSCIINKVVKNVATDYSPPLGYCKQQLDVMLKTVFVTVIQAKEICMNTMEQRKSP